MVSQQALLIKGAQNCGSKVWDLHMEQLGHVGRRVRGRWGFRYSLQTQPLTDASKKKKKEEEGMENALVKRNAVMKNGVIENA